MKDKFVRGSLVFIGLPILLFGGCVTQPPSEQCALSLCDCKCHPPGSTLEEMTGGVCGINCLAQTGVSGCSYVDGACREVYSQPSGCSADSDCALNGSRCADGIDPYHVCQNGSCVNLTFIADPCLMSHVCPKGSWDYSTGARCTKIGPCSKEGCDDRSGATEDVCVNQSTPGEGCEYRVRASTDCLSDIDCVPEQCCHPTTCMNKDYKTVCTLFCTDVCMGPIDCGAGQCACLGGKCAVHALV